VTHRSTAASLRSRQDKDPRGVTEQRIRQLVNSVPSNSPSTLRRPSIEITSSPFILSRSLGGAVLLGCERRGHVHDGVAGCRLVPDSELGSGGLTLWPWATCPPRPCRSPRLRSRSLSSGLSGGPGTVISGARVLSWSSGRHVARRRSGPERRLRWLGGSTRPSRAGRGSPTRRRHARSRRRCRPRSIAA
jgi:hypothetical protein